MTYQEFIERKRIADAPTGLREDVEISSRLFGFQQAVVRWALRRGRAAIWADCGLGKTAMQLEWSLHVPGRVLIFAPLAVGPQTESEGNKFGIECKYLREDDGKTKIVVTNYEIAERFNPHNFNGVVLDESSILKSYTGRTRTYLIETWSRVPFRLCCTATPAPNDFMELGNHAEFIGSMTRSEMLSMFFVHDGSETQQWRLKGHAESRFWEWVASWAVMFKKPSDIGYSDDGFDLPPCYILDSVVRDQSWSQDTLFPMHASTLEERLQARRRTVDARCEHAAYRANELRVPVVCWCNLNDESSKLHNAIKDSVEVSGSDSLEEKEARMMAFTRGDARVMVTKPSIAGFGMNWQHCANMMFVGLSDSYEQFYQALRRCWRFGQKHPVTARVVTADTEGAVTANIRRKEADAERMSREMVAHMADINNRALHGTSRSVTLYHPSRSISIRL